MKCGARITLKFVSRTQYEARPIGEINLSQSFCARVRSLPDNGPAETKLQASISAEIKSLKHKMTFSQ